MEISNGGSCRLYLQEGFTPLHIAASRGTPEVVGALLEAGAHVNAQCNVRNMGK